MGKTFDLVASLFAWGVILWILIWDLVDYKAVNANSLPLLLIGLFAFAIIYMCFIPHARAWWHGGEAPVPATESATPEDNQLYANFYMGYLVLVFVVVLFIQSPFFTPSFEEQHQNLVAIMAFMIVGFVPWTIYFFVRAFRDRRAAAERSKQDSELLLSVAPLVEHIVRDDIAAVSRPSALKNEYLEIVGRIVLGMLLELQKKLDKPDKKAGLEDLFAYHQRSDLPTYYSQPFVKALAAFNGKLPDYVGEPAIFEAQLGTIPHVKAIEDFHFAFRDTVFHWIWTEYERRFHAVENGVKGKYYEWGSKEFYKRLTQGTVFESIFSPEITVPITIPLEHRFRGVYIIAPPDKGKTTLLSQLLKSDIELIKKGAASVILMDSKGDLVDGARQLQGLEGRIVLIEPNANLAINPLDIGANDGIAVEMIEYLLSGLMETAPTELQLTLLRAVIPAMLVIPGANLDTMRDFLSGDWRNWNDDLKKMREKDYRFFSSGKYDSDTYKKTKTEIDWRIQNLVGKNPLISDMFSAPKTLVKMGELMDSGKLIIIDNNKEKLGTSGAEFFGRFFMFLTLYAAQQRASQDMNERVPTFLYIDEADTVVSRDNNLAELIARCRSMKVGVVLAHQFLYQIKSFDVLSAMQNCGVRFANVDGDAPKLADNMRTTTQILRSLNQGEFVMFAEGLTKPDPLIIKTNNNPIWKWPRVDAKGMAALRAEMAKNYHYQNKSQPTQGPTDTSPQPWAP